MTAYGVRFPGGQVAPLPSLSSARGTRNVWGRIGITTELVHHTADGWRVFTEGASE